MTSFTRPLYRPGRASPPPGDGLPRADSRGGAQARDEIVEALGHLIPRRGRNEPEPDFSGRVRAEADAMILGDRVRFELDMAERMRTAYSSDYDALRYGTDHESPRSDGLPPPDGGMGGRGRGWY